MLTIRQVMAAGKERAARLAKREHALFYFNEYIKFETIKDFADYFGMDLQEAIHQVTFGRRVDEEGVTPA